MKEYRVLIVDDEPSVHKLLSRVCGLMNWKVDSAYSGHEALELIEQYAYPICILDVNMAGPSGVELADNILDKNLATAIIIFTGYARVNEAVQAIKRGVCDYVKKEAMDVNEIQNVLLRAAEFHENRLRQVVAQNDRLSHFTDVENANQTFQAIVDMCGELIFLIDAKQSTIIDCNMTAVESLSCPRSNIIGQKITNFCMDFGSSDWSEMIGLSRRQEPTLRETEFRTASGDVFPAEISCGYVALETGEYLSLIVRDITKRRIIEAKLQTANQKLFNYTQKLKTIMDSIEDGIMLINKEGMVEMVNQGMVRLSKTSEAFVLEKQAKLVLQELFNQDFSDLIESYSNGDTIMTERLKGSMVDNPVTLTFQPIIHDEQLLGIVVSVSDISDMIREHEMVRTDILHQKKILEYKSSDMMQSMQSLTALIECLNEMELTTEQQVVVNSMLEFTQSFEQQESSQLKN